MSIPLNSINYNKMIDEDIKSLQGSIKVLQKLEDTGVLTEELQMGHPLYDLLCYYDHITKVLEYSKETYDKYTLPNTPHTAWNC